ncbi:MAG: ribosome small subunit-dependent GTPase A [Aeromicrobium sp.]
MKDEHEDFDRPRRRTRPRTKERPNYEHLPVGRVRAVDRGRYRVDIDGTSVTTMKARSLGRQGVVVGDEVRVDGDVTGGDGTLARIAEVLPRATVLRRTADDDDPIERIVVANADQLVVVTALADPPPRPALIDRCLVAAYDARMRPVVVLTKADLASPDEMLGLLEPLDVEVVVTQRDAGVDPVRAVLAGRTSVLVGHSGVGKSTLVNALVPDADRAVSTVNDVTGRGRHTSTSAIALPLPGGGWIIDTPGFRSFGLAHVDIDHIVTAFSDVADICTACPRGCTHLATEPECALDTAVTDGRITTARVESLRRILDARSKPAYLTE